MGDATHRESTTNKPKQGGKNMKTISEQLTEMIEDKMDEVSHTLIEDYPKGDYMDGYIAALEWILSEVGE